MKTELRQSRRTATLNKGTYGEAKAKYACDKTTVNSLKNVGPAYRATSIKMEAVTSAWLPQSQVFGTQDDPEQFRSKPQCEGQSPGPGEMKWKRRLFTVAHSCRMSWWKFHHQRGQADRGRTARFQGGGE